MGQAKIVFLLLTFGLAGCSGGYTHVLYAQPSGSLKTTTARLQHVIARAEQNGCRINNISMGAGQGVGVGVNISADCPECTKQDLNRTVEKRTFGAVAMAVCERPNHIDEHGNLR